MEKLDQDVCNALGIQSINDDFELSNSNGVDSLARATIIVMAEEEFGKTITNEQFLSIKTYGELKRLMRDD